MRTGTLGLVTTAWPRLASVGARMTASTAASQKFRSANIIAANSVPTNIIKGNPMASRRSGNV